MKPTGPPVPAVPWFAVALVSTGMAAGALGTLAVLGWSSRSDGSSNNALPQAVSFTTLPRVDAMKRTAGSVSNQAALARMVRHAFLYKENSAVRALLADVAKHPELRDLWQAVLQGTATEEAVRKAAASPALMDLLDKHTFRVLGAVVSKEGKPRKDSETFIPQAGFVSQSVPAEMVAGRAYPVTVTVTNVGNTTWSKKEGYILGSQKPEGNARWGMQHVELGEGQAVAPGERMTYAFSVTAPAAPGRYDFQWRMCLFGVRWFGLYSPNVQVSVLPEKPGAGPRR